MSPSPAAVRISTDEELRGGTFGPPSNEPTDYLLMTGLCCLGDSAEVWTAETIGETHEHIAFALDRRQEWIRARGSTALMMEHGDVERFFMERTESKPGSFFFAHSVLGCMDTDPGCGFVPDMTPGCFSGALYQEDAAEMGQRARDRYLAWLYLHPEDSSEVAGPETVRCGGEDAGNPFFCGEMVPLWFADFDDNGPPRCGRCVSGVPGGPYQSRYPRPCETEDEYNAEARKTEAENAAVADQYEQMAKDFRVR